MGGRHGTHADGSHVHCHPINGLGTRLCPCGIATATPQTFTVASRPRRNRPSLKFPARHEGRVRAANQPESTGFRAGIRSRGVTQPISHVYLPVSLTAPAPSGSPGTTRLCRGCSRPPRRPADQAASCFTPPLRRQGDRGLPPPFGPNSASWRTFLAYTFPSRSPRPAHPAVPGRRDFVEAAPTLPGDPRLRLPPASPHRCDGEEMDGLSPPSGTTAPRGAPTSVPEQAENCGHQRSITDTSNTRNGPRVMASLRNLAIAILRLTGHASIAAALRYRARQPGRPLQTITQC